MKDIYTQLLCKSEEAFIVGIELYNKPTIQYRIEGFSFFICNAWELMLKAYLIKNKGYQSIYYRDAPDRTISLDRCIQLVFTNKKDPLRRNLEKIINLRNTSTHFITNEYETIYIPLFQACVHNYTEKMLSFFGIDITQKISSNFLTLSVRLDSINTDDILARYPQDIAQKLIETISDINSSINDNESMRFAVHIRHDFYITKKQSEANATIGISKEASNAAFILKEVRDMQNICPFTTAQCIDLINKYISSQGINFINPNAKDTSKLSLFNKYHFNLFVKFYNLKDSNKYCYRYDRGSSAQYSYSNALIDFVCGEIKKDPQNIIANLKNNIKK